MSAPAPTLNDDVAVPGLGLGNYRTPPNDDIAEYLNVVDFDLTAK